MIIIDNVDVFNFENAIRGMRNPLNSWNRIDSHYNENGDYVLGPNDLGLASKLADGGEPHRKFMRQIFVSADITAPMYWWSQFDTYKVGTTANSTSKMHKLASLEILLDDFSSDKCVPEGKDAFKEIIRVCNKMREKFLETNDKSYWYTMIQLLPEGYNQTRTVTMDYENLANMYRWRKNHKLDEWKDFCKWCETLPYAKEFIVNKQDEMNK